MLKRFLRVLFPLLLLTSPAFAVGTIPLSMTQQLDQFGVPLSGCLLYTIQAGTTSTPQNAFKDTGLTLPQPNPMVCDASGRLPQFFLADGQIKIRLVDRLGNPQTVLDNILVIGPSSGGGGGGTIDPTTIATTGDLKQSYGTQVITGWVRFNGRTIGNATSGATERANADTQALFLYLWAADVNLTVSGGRTTAAADYAANKTIALPDGRGKTLAALTDMGNSVSSVLTQGTAGCTLPTTTLGSFCGSQSETLTLAQLPTGIASSGSATGITVSLPGASSLLAYSSNGDLNPFSAAATGAFVSQYSSGNNWAYSHSMTGSGSASVTSSNTLGNAHTTVQPTLLVTIYIKL